MTRAPDEYLEAHIREALATDDRTNYLDPQIRVAAGKVFLMGAVESADRKLAAERVVREIAPAELQIINEIWVESYDTPTASDERI